MENVSCHSVSDIRSSSCINYPWARPHLQKFSLSHETAEARRASSASSRNCQHKHQPLPLRWPWHMIRIWSLASSDLLMHLQELPHRFSEQHCTSLASFRCSRTGSIGRHDSKLELQQALQGLWIWVPEQSTGPELLRARL